MKQEVEWISTEVKLHPDKPGLSRYEQIPCLVIFKDSNYIENLVWNCEHLVWDGADGDDYACDADKIAYWMAFPLTPKQLENIKV